MKDLIDLRNEIDKIDDEIQRLFVERMDLCTDVAKYKQQNSKSVNDSSREDNIIYRLAQKTKSEYQYYLKEVYSTIFSVSKSHQSKLLNTTTKTIEDINNAISENLVFPTTSTVACQGINGANSGLAAKSIFPICNISYFKNFEGVFSAVDKGFCEYGVLPIENSTAGSVLEVYDLMNKYSFYIVRSIRVKINHCLAVLPNADISDIKKVVSHSQALTQCASFIKNLNVESQAVENTAVSAKMVADNNDKTIASICSKESAEIYGLKILQENVQDNMANFTRFIVISKNLKVFEGSDRISVITSAPHETGSLSKILARFSALGLSLTKIESRPIVGSDFEFLFYFDFEGSVKDKGVAGLITELEKTSQRFEFLGCYKEII